MRVLSSKAKNERQGHPQRHCRGQLGGIERLTGLAWFREGEAGLMKTWRKSRISDLGRFFETGCVLGQKLPHIRHEEGRKAGTASRSNDSLGFERCFAEVQ